nr:MAG TPA: hypothetical protein [Caudoviricetes sp.]
MAYKSPAGCALLVGLRGLPNGEHNCRVRPCYLYPYHRHWYCT